MIYRNLIARIVAFISVALGAIGLSHDATAAPTLSSPSDNQPSTAPSVTVELDQAEAGKALVRLSFVNRTNTKVMLMRSQIPIGKDPRQLFAVSSDIGPIPISAMPFTAFGNFDASHIPLEPGMRIEYTIDLAPFYDFTAFPPDATDLVRVTYTGEPVLYANVARTHSLIMGIDRSVTGTSRALVNRTALERPFAAANAVNGYVLLNMSTSDRDTTAKNKELKVYMHGIKQNIGQTLDLVVGNYTSGSNSRHYDLTDVHVNLSCPGVGSNIPPYSTTIWLDDFSLSPGKKKTFTYLKCDYPVTSRGFGVSASASITKTST